MPRGSGENVPLPARGGFRGRQHPLFGGKQPLVFFPLKPRCFSDGYGRHWTQRAHLGRQGGDARETNEALLPEGGERGLLHGAERQ